MAISTSAIMSQLNAYAKTETGKKKINTYIKASTKSSSNLQINKNMYSYAKRLRDILREEILNIQNQNGIAFLDYINIENSIKVVNVNGLEYLSIGIYFEDDVWSNSLWYSKYEMGAYLPYLFNNNYLARNKVYGRNNNGNYISSAITLSDCHTNTINFMAKAVDRFNSETSNKGVKAEYNVNYNGGTFGTNEY